MFYTKIRFFRFVLAIFCLGFLLSASCKETTVKLPPELAGKLKLESFVFKYLSARTKMNLDMGNNVRTAAEIRIKKDSVIWLSLRPALNIEALRVSITKDSICYMDKLQKEYDTKSYAEISQLIGLEANYQLLEDFFVGNLIETGQTYSAPEKLETDFLLKQDHVKFSMEALVGRQNAKVSQYKVLQKGIDNNMRVDYSDFKPINKLLFAHRSKILTNYRDENNEAQKIEIDIEHEKVEMLAQAPAFNFKIPSNYKKRAPQKK